MKVLALEGSPRKGGNSSLLLDWVLEGVKKGGGGVVRLRVADLDIQPCTGCGVCLSAGECVIRDDMDGVMDLVFSTHHMVVATPVYFYHVPAQLKALVDRFQPLWARKALLGVLPEKRGRLAIVACGGTRGKRLFECVLLTFEILSPSLGLEFSPFHLLVKGVDERGDVEKVEGLREKARDFGLNFVIMGQERGHF